MKRKLALLIGILALFATKMSAQTDSHYGLFLGGSVNWMKIDKSLYVDDSEAFTTLNMSDTTMVSAYFLNVKNAYVSPNTGFAFGGLYEFKINELIGIQAELFINQYGYKLHGEVTQKDILDNDSTTYSYKSSLKTTNISAALLLKFYPSEFVSVDLGVQPAYSFKMIKDIERGIDHKTHSYNSKEEYNPLNVSASLGATIYLNDFFISLRYTMGFTNILKAKRPYYLNTGDNGGSIEYRYTDATSKIQSASVTFGFRWN